MFVLTATERLSSEQARQSKSLHTRVCNNAVLLVQHVSDHNQMTSSRLMFFESFQQAPVHLITFTPINARMDLGLGGASPPGRAESVILKEPQSGREPV
jgi:hypothetical protein